MVDELDEILDRKIDEKLGLYKVKSRRTANELRDLIQRELEKRPKTTHELVNAVDATRSTVENHCSHLQRLGVIKQVEFDETSYWRLDG